MNIIMGILFPFILVVLMFFALCIHRLQTEIRLLRDRVAFKDSLIKEFSDSVYGLSDRCYKLDSKVVDLFGQLTEAIDIRIKKVDELDKRVISTESFIENVKENAKKIRESREETFNNMRARLAR